MSKKRNKARGEPAGNKARAEPAGNRSGLFLCSPDAYEIICSDGYTSLSKNPEIIAGVNKIAGLVSSMTIHLMGNTSGGDIRIRNELAKKIDINPNRYMTRKTFISTIVRTLLLEGEGNCVVYPVTEGGLIKDLVPIPPARVSYIPEGPYGYKILRDGVEHEPDEVLHFVLNPDPNYPWKGTGCKAQLKEVADSLKQAQETKNGFMKSKWRPSIIVKVDGLTDEFSNVAGRRALLEQYLESSEAGEPWMIPADQFSVETVTPLSITDLALPDSVRLDKRTVSSILSIPAFVVGEGEYNRDEWNNFIDTTIRMICNTIEQELTKKLLLSPEWYFKFNARSLHAYDIDQLANVGSDLYTRGIMTGNEVRDWIGMSPKDGLDELIILENFIPQDMIGDQKKLKTGGENNE